MWPDLECRGVRGDVYQDIGSEAERRRNDEIYIDLVQVRLKVDWPERKAGKDVDRMAERLDFGLPARIDVPERVVSRISIAVS